MTYKIIGKTGKVLDTFDDIISALGFLRYLAWEDCREDYMNWQVCEMFEKGYKSPSDIPEIEKELKQHEMIREHERNYTLEEEK